MMNINKKLILVGGMELIAVILAAIANIQLI